MNFQDDSDDDLEWNPNDDEILLAEDNDVVVPRKRKVAAKEAHPKKKKKTENECQKCNKTFSRKDSLQRHLKNFCK